MTEFEEKVEAAIRAAYERDHPAHRVGWLAVRVAAAINASLAWKSPMGSLVPPTWFSETEVLPRQQAALAALRGEP